MKFIFTTVLVICLSGFGFQSLALSAASEDTGNVLKKIYVAVSGDDAFSGEYDAPLATVKEALRRIQGDEDTRIALFGGEYQEQVTITGRGRGKLTLTSVPGEQVLFRGSVPVTDWVEEDPGVYRIPGAISEQQEPNVWEDDNRIRYQLQLDARGVRAWPGSFCRLDDGDILIHTRDRKTPQELELRISQHPFAIEVRSSNVRISGLNFRDYLGERFAGAIRIAVSRKNIEITDCRTVNTVQAIQIGRHAENIRVERCDLRDTGIGILNTGYDVEIRDCIIFSASGEFMIRAELGKYEHNGIRTYYPAAGGVVERCLTAGFSFGGIRTKTNPSVEGERIFVFRHNVSLEGFRWEGDQKFNQYLSNISGGGLARLHSLIRANATIEDNYFFSLREFQEKALTFEDGNNVHGGIPVLFSEQGSVGWHADWYDTLSEQVKQEVLSMLEDREIQVSPLVASKVAPLEEPVEEAVKFMETPHVESSLHGAVITAYLNQQSRMQLLYRERGRSAWTLQEAYPHSFSDRNVINRIKEDPLDEEEESDRMTYRISFSLTGKLQKEKNYEYILRTHPGQIGDTVSHQGEFQTTGGTKEIRVKTGGEPEGGGGSVSDMQKALDRVLPGDTVYLEAGVYTSPVILTTSGTPDLPIAIKGAGWNETVWDGGWVSPVLLELNNTSYVSIEGIQFRWFTSTGLFVQDSEYIEIQGCAFLNRHIHSSTYADGEGILLKNSPNCGISFSLFTRLLYGFVLFDSPRARIQNNTCFKNTYSSANLVRSAQNSEITLNSFGFSNHSAIVFRERSAEALRTLTCDYNNWATPTNRARPVRPENDFSSPERYTTGTGKSMISWFTGLRETGQYGGQLIRYFRLQDWREFSGLDKNTIFADPDYSDPVNMDFRLLEGSPNILSDGRIMGAFPAVEETQP